MAATAVAWITLGLAGLCAAVASVLLKNATAHGIQLLSSHALALAIGAISVYGIGFLLYGYALKFLNVGIAYVCMVAVAATLLFTYSLVRGEPVGPREWSGAAAIVLGVFLIAGPRV